MKKAALKIKDNSGVSILLALFFVFIAVMVSTVITSGAATASRNVIYKNNRQNAYLTVYSAAEYIIDDIENAEYRKGKPSSELTASEGTAVIFSDLLKDGIDKVQENKELPEGTAGTPFIKSFTVEAGADGHTFKPVTVKFQMTDGYDIKMDLCLADATMDTNYNMTVSMNSIGGKWKLQSINKGQRIEGAAA